MADQPPKQRGRGKGGWGRGRGRGGSDRLPPGNSNQASSQQNLNSHDGDKRDGGTKSRDNGRGKPRGGRMAHGSSMSDLSGKHQSRDQSWNNKSRDQSNMQHGVRARRGSVGSKSECMKNAPLLDTPPNFMPLNSKFSRGQQMPNMRSPGPMRGDPAPQQRAFPFPLPMREGPSNCMPPNPQFSRGQRMPNMRAPGPMRGGPPAAHWQSFTHLPGAPRYTNPQQEQPYYTYPQQKQPYYTYPQQEQPYYTYPQQEQPYYTYPQQEHSCGGTNIRQFNRGGRPGDRGRRRSHTDTDDQRRSESASSNHEKRNNKNAFQDRSSGANGSSNPGHRTDYSRSSYTKTGGGGYRGRGRRGRWSQYSSRCNNSVQDGDTEDDDGLSQCETVSVRSSSPVSVMSDMHDLKDFDDNIHRDRVSADDIHTISDELLRNRLRRYRKKNSRLKKENPVNQDEIDHLNVVIEKINKELVDRKRSEKKEPDNSTEANIKHDELYTGNKRGRSDRPRKRFRDRGRGRGREGWAQCTRRYNNTDIEDDDTSQCDTVSVRSSSPVSVMSDMPDLGEFDGLTRYNISIDDIGKVSALTLNNRIKRYQMKITTLKSEKNIDTEKIKYINYIISEIRKELKRKREEAKQRDVPKENAEVEDVISDKSEDEANHSPGHKNIAKPRIRKRPAKVPVKKGGVSFRPGITGSHKQATKAAKSDINKDVEPKGNSSQSAKEGSCKSNKKDSSDNLKPAKKDKQKLSSQHEVEKENTVIGESEIKKMEAILNGLDFNFCQDKLQNSIEEIGKGLFVDAGSGFDGDTDTRHKDSNEKNKKKNVTKRQTKDKINTPKDDVRKRRVSENVAEGPDVNEVFKFMVKFMSGEGTAELLGSISKLFPEAFDLDMIKKWFKKHTGRFTLLYRGEDLSYIFVLKKELKYCFDYTTARSCQKADTCPFVHICRDYFRGYCKYGDQRCRFSHSHMDEHNMRLVKTMGYHTVFTSEQICSIIRVRYPHLCQRWNEGECYDELCPKLHMCSRYVFDECLDGENCLMVHDRFTEHNKPIVDAYLIGHWNERLFKKMIIIDKQEPNSALNTVTKDPAPTQQTQVSSETTTLTKPSTTNRANRVLITQSENKTYVTTTQHVDTESTQPYTGNMTTQQRTQVAHQTDVVRPKNTVNVIETAKINVPTQPSAPRYQDDPGDPFGVCVTTVKDTYESVLHDRYNVSTQQGTPAYQQRASTASHIRHYHKEVAPTQTTQHESLFYQQPGGTDNQQGYSTNTKDKPTDVVEDDATSSPASDKAFPNNLSDDFYICDLDLVDKCNHGDCKLHHSRTLKRPYVWQVKMFGMWITIEDDEEIVENRFCSHRTSTGGFFLPKHGVSLMFLFRENKIKAQFDDQLDYTELKARRISTPSFIEGDSGNQSFKTQWRWYWEDDYGGWSLFEPDTMQFTLESKYLAGQKEYYFSRENYKHKNRIDFASMVQLNLDTSKRRKIQRRPLMVSARDVRHRKYPSMLQSPPLIDMPLPEGWVPWDQTNKFELVILDQGSREYKEVYGKFYETLSRNRQTIQCVYRIQSHQLWLAFCGRETLMNTTLKASDPQAVLNRRDLFHGTDDFDTVRGICTQNFDHRVSGKNATLYGDGAYFARDAKYSHCYTGNGPEHYMFLANVLVGKFTEGKKEYRRPPEIPGARHELYDSCVDKMRDPSIFIIFEKSQVYPAYLIQYTDNRDADRTSTRFTQHTTSYAPQPYPSTLTSQQTTYPSTPSPTKQKQSCAIQ